MFFLYLKPLPPISLYSLNFQIFQQYYTWSVNYFDLFLLKHKLVFFTTFFQNESYFFKKKTKKFTKKNSTTSILEKFLNFYIWKGQKNSLLGFLIEILENLGTTTPLGNFSDSYFFSVLKNIPIVTLVTFLNQGISYSVEKLLYRKLTESFVNVNTIFIFRFNKIDKKVRKYSRGKSGKYKCVFKYLPYYKRINFLFLMLKRDFIFLKDLKLNTRLSLLIYNFFFKKHSLIFNIKRYSNFFFMNNVSSLRAN